MVLVYFHGRGDWFIKDSDGNIKQAIYRPASLFEPGYMDGEDRLPSLVIEHRYCQEFDGVFSLTDDDEKKIEMLKQSCKDAEEAFLKIKPSIKKLSPCTHEFSVFSKMVKQGKLSANDIEQCYFIIQKEYKRKKKYVDQSYELTLIASDLKHAGNPINGQNKNYNGLDPRAEDTYLRTIGALLDFVEGKTPGFEKHQNFENRSKLIEKLANAYQGYPGLSKRNMESLFPKAKKALDDI